MKADVESPVLLIVFNRPDTTKVVFDAIRKSKPKKLYVSADAPRKGNEKDKTNCEEVRKIVEQVDWDCEVKYRFLDENLGCGWGPASAITWAFEKEDRMIIIEDDCVPSQPFFPYCNYLLEKFKDDDRVWLISGRSHQSKSRFFENQDYIFSHYGHSWGWATWKRCWDHFDMDMKDFPDFIKTGGAENVFSTLKEGTLYNKKYKKLFADKSLHTHVWDFQFGYAITKNGGLSIVPAKNLIKNIGYFGTHTKKENEYTALEAAEEFSIEREPQFVLINRDFEKLHFNNHIKKVFGYHNLLQRIVRKVLKKLKWH
ncbi:hypothetical protein DSECCO2_192820 [anaerobic digester metagenome]